MTAKAKWIYLGLGGIAALGLVFGTAFAFVHTADAAASVGSGPGSMAALRFPGGVIPDHFGPGRPPDGDGPLGDHQEALADALGISVEELDAAYAEARAAAIADGVEQGQITHDQADEMLQDQPGERGGGRGFLSPDTDFDTYPAQALGISTDRLEQARTEARETLLAQALEDGTITPEEADRIRAREAVRGYVEEAMASAYSEALGQAVADGVITQAQADLLTNQSGGLHGGPGFGRSR